MAKYPEITVEASADYSALAIRAHHKMRQAGVPSDECDQFMDEVLAAAVRGTNGDNVLNVITKWVVIVEPR